MDLTRTVTMPLAKNPELLWGLSLTEMPWLGAGLVGQVWLWNSGGSLSLRLALMAVSAGACAIAAWGRFSGRTVVAWLWLWGRFTARPKIYLPELCEAGPEPGIVAKRSQDPWR